MSAPTSTRCGCLTMQHPRWQAFRDSSEYEADHCQKHIDWDAFVEKHEAECPKMVAHAGKTDLF
jgi:hypothetical protein